MSMEKNEVTERWSGPVLPHISQAHEEIVSMFL